jgi:hypothetical protein
MLLSEGRIYITVDVAGNVQYLQLQQVLKVTTIDMGM